MKLIANKAMNAVLCFSDGTFFFGNGIGVTGKVVGEVCFNTSMTGYQEILTDPSYAGQIITFTFPHIGNVGCNSEDYESNTIYCNGLIIREDITNSSNFRSEHHLNDWLTQNNITGISNVDTRHITQNIRTNGAMNVVILHAQEGETMNTDLLIQEIETLPTLHGKELSNATSTKQPYNFHEQTFRLGQTKYHTLPTSEKRRKVVVIDYGVKKNILRSLVDSGFDITIVPAMSSYEDIMSYNPDGVFLSNGPGDPLETAKYAVPVIKELFEANIPIFGICMGHQLIALSLGLKTIKMHQGHRGANHPVKNLENSTVEITSQNHGFCVSSDNIPNNIKITHISLFDKTIQGIKHLDRPVFSVQYHPESSPGPHDSQYLFKDFTQLINNQTCRK